MYLHCLCFATAMTVQSDFALRIAEHDGFEPADAELECQDSSDWSFVDSDVDEHEEPLLKKVS